MPELHRLLDIVLSWEAIAWNAKGNAICFRNPDDPDEVVALEDFDDRV
ncbi:MAG: hypothetical protein F6K65_22790 [Moorea sp. SIO3C2]|nr:hypothetical protein [Moorena sp. SIO3C2]